MRKLRPGDVAPGCVARKSPRWDSNPDLPNSTHSLREPALRRPFPRHRCTSFLPWILSLRAQRKTDGLGNEQVWDPLKHAAPRTEKNL